MIIQNKQHVAYTYSAGKTMDFQDDNIIFSNFTYNPNYYYFIYIGDLKAYGLNTSIKETFSRRIFSKEVKFISIIPDICIQYNYPDIFVINPEAKEDSVDEDSQKLNLKPYRKSCRVKYDSFISAVCKNKTVHHLINKILEKQNQLYISLYESIEEVTLDEIDRVTILGPDKKIAEKFNNKIFQYETFKDIVPMADFRICQGFNDLLQTSASIRQEWSDGIFISAPFSAAGSNSAVTLSQEQTASTFTDPKSPYVLAKYIPHQYDPTVLAVVANENDVYIAGITDQVIVDGNRFVGSKYPTVLPKNQQEQLNEYTRKVGKVLGENGYRGIFGCDYIIDNDGNCIFLEINARKQGTTLEFCHTLEQSLPEGSPTLMELEYCAVTEDRFPKNTVELTGNNRNLH